MNRLTSQQQAVYDYIRQNMVQRGYVPTVREIGQHLGIRSPNGIMCHLKALEKKGMIRRTANRSRAIELAEPLPGNQLSWQIQGRVAAGKVLMLSDSFQTFEPLSALSGGQLPFLLQITDDSYAQQRIAAGDMLVVHRSDAAQERTPQAGQWLVMQSPGTGECLLATIESSVAHRTVRPLSESPYTTDISHYQTVGVVVGVIRLLGVPS
ncbi:MAG: repressor LexA [Pirellulaceae bacterium]|nr:repressor LexA [Pirellulaceae bacterium]